MPDELLDKCPSAVRDANITWDTLRVSVPYQGVRDNVVEVPPLVPDTPFSSWLHGEGSTVGHGPLTTSSGKRPDRPDASYIVGWDRDGEKQQREELIEKAEAMVAMADAGELHPQAQGFIKTLAQSALSDLDRVRRTYKAWGESMVVARPSDSPFSFYQMYDGFGPIGLDQEWSMIRQWMRDPAAEGGDGRPMGDLTPQYFQTFSELLNGETGGWEGVGEPTSSHFHAAMIAARERDRQKIRRWLLDAYRKIWCAEYGVAQSESYYANKAQYEAGPGRFDPSGSIRPRPTPVPEMDFIPLPVPPSDTDLDTDVDTTDEPPPPVIGPSVPTKWYQTTAGKIAIAAGALSLSSALGYSIYTYVRNRAA